FSSRRRHTRWPRDWSSDVCSSDLTPLGSARWRQRAGRIQVEGMGAGFGGRSLCLSKRVVPKAPFEACLTVKLDDESGAAGLVFRSEQRRVGKGGGDGGWRVR